MRTAVVVAVLVEVAGVVGATALSALLVGGTALLLTGRTDGLRCWNLLLIVAMVARRCRRASIVSARQSVR